MRKHVVLGMVALGTAIATSASESTPYDLIRPVYPLKWDNDAFDKFELANTENTGLLPKEKKPESYKANAFIPDSLDQAYYDALNTHISPIRVNQAGYLTSDTERQFYYIGEATKFEIVDADGNSLSPAVTGDLTSKTTEVSSDWTIKAQTNALTLSRDRYTVSFAGSTGVLKAGKIPQSVPTDKRLRIKIGDEISSTFIVSDKVYSMVRDASLKFFGIQRSGESESWFHDKSHTKDGSGKFTYDDEEVSEFTPQEGALQGGWYDCGDHLKESMTMSYAFMSLAIMAATNESKDKDHYAYNQSETVNTDGIPDILREAKHGADFFIRSYNFANGIIDNMVVSVGNFGADHGYWGKPEEQDTLSAIRRGNASERDLRLGELGSNISGIIAAGLAIMGKQYAVYDKAYAETCLKIAEEMYDFARSLAQGKSSYGDGKLFKYNKRAASWATPAYNGNNEFYDDLALASVALLYATGKTVYADDALRSKDLVNGQTFGDGAGFFEGGWFATNDKGFFKNAKNTSWANSYAFATYALYKLILADKTKATTEYGLSETEWLNAIEDCITDMIANLGDISQDDGTASISLLSDAIAWKQGIVKYDANWFNMQTDLAWQYNAYQAGNIFEVLAYADVAADLEKKNLTLPNLGAVSWKSGEMWQLGINQLNYMLGVNPWDISFVYGVGDKNDAHPFHRASNPEGRNMENTKDYKYRVPVGALYGGTAPQAKSAIIPQNTSVEDYHISEACLAGSATLMAATTIVSSPAEEGSGPTVGIKKTTKPLKSATIDQNTVSLMIHAPGNGQKRVQVFDLLGNTVYKANFNSENINVPFSAMRHKGALQVRVFNGGKVAAAKTIILK
ncbi:MAG: glycoside hydrolase family 9 protein [Fibrobacter sp.]|nr:glycoside hydrolase family 9 protein [Fibrobacter sp.]